MITGGREAVLAGGGRRELDEASPLDLQSFLRCESPVFLDGARVCQPGAVTPSPPPPPPPPPPHCAATSRHSRRMSPGLGATAARDPRGLPAARQRSGRDPRPRSTAPRALGHPS